MSEEFARVRIPVSSEISTSHRRKLGVVADALIPAEPPMPAASDVHVSGRGLDRVLQAQPRLGERLVGILDTIGDGDPGEQLLRCRSEDPSGYSLLVLVVCSAYYMNEGVRDLIGYPGQIPVLRSDLNDMNSSDVLLKPVIERGAIYRETP